MYKGQLYFTAFTPVLGEELWRTDDTEGAVLLHGDACPGTCNGTSYDYLLSPMVEYKSQLVFNSKNPNMGSDLLQHPILRPNLKKSSRPRKGLLRRYTAPLLPPRILIMCGLQRFPNPKVLTLPQWKVWELLKNAKPPTRLG